MPQPAPPASGAPIILNIFVGGATPQQVRVQPAVAPEQGVEGYHLAVDENGIPHDHADMLWGDYIDRQGRPAVGYHSHDPVAGNAR